MHNDNQSGFGLIGTAGILVSAILIIVCGWLVYSRSTSSSVSTSSQPANKTVAEAISKAYADYVATYKRPPATVSHSINPPGIYLCGSSCSTDGEVLIPNSSYSDYSVTLYTYSNVPKLYAGLFYVAEGAKCVNKDSAALTSASSMQAAILYTIPSTSASVTQCLDV